MRQDWVNLTSNPTVGALLDTLVELQERVVRLEADMVLLKSGSPDAWAAELYDPSDPLQETQ